MRTAKVSYLRASVSPCRGADQTIRSALDAAPAEERAVRGANARVIAHAEVALLGGTHETIRTPL
ncbi:hypothetical protein [Botrimarina hoheduenensis]|uniref:hypothetical protein n=1 Tax=Botrimarina hoheduenensis TaxID=2528000 RepID=UPI0011B49199|nr:hypothetical protein [Botrimarina hoheduenensis]